MAGTGHNSNNFVGVNSLNKEDKDKLRGTISELNDSMTRVAAERDLQKEILNDICEKLGLNKKLVRRMAKAFFLSNFNDEIETNKQFEEFYEMVINRIPSNPSKE